MTLGFARQVRAYVLQPYTLAKDLRTAHQTDDVYRVLDGQIDDFLIEGMRLHRQIQITRRDRGCEPPCAELD